MAPLFRLWVGVGLLLLAGCNNSNNTTPESGSPKVATKPPTASHDDHEHKIGAHAGLIVPLGNDRYHAEAVFEIGGVLRIYLLGADERTVKEIDEQTLDGHIKLVGSSLWMPVTLKPAPQPGDLKGKTSQFTGQVPPEFVGKHIVVKFAAVRIGKDRYRLAFESRSQDEHDTHREEPSTMPSKVTQSEEQKLYLTPGGKYTAADIQANGNIVASTKFKGVKAEHDLKPKAGDKICPITLTKANRQFSWIIDGKSYEFCCPPCVDEFVGLAKEKPGEVLAPDAYVQK